MSESVVLRYKDRPSTFICIILAWLGRTNTINNYEISAIWENAKIDTKHLDDFKTICGFKDYGEHFFLIYPLTLVNPLYMRMLCRKEAPLFAYNALNVRSRIIQHSPINPNQILDIHCRTGEQRFIAKGMELDYVTEIRTNGKLVWENIHTFFYLGNFGESNNVYLPPQLEPITDADTITEWYLPDGLGLRFAKISGDPNGLHWSFIYTRLIRLKRTFAQPILPVARTIASLENIIKQDRYNCLDIRLKGPVYYKSNITIKGVSNETGFSFDIYCEGNPRPCINCKLSYQSS